MSLADKLGNVYVTLNEALDDANSALIEKGGNEAVNILNIGNEIRNLETGGSDELASTIIKDHPSHDITITLPRVDSIRDCALYGFYDLKTLIIPDSVTTIGLEAFYDCNNLTNVVINGNRLTNISNRAFYYCAFTNISIPSSVTSIGTGAFQNCEYLTDIYFNSITPPTAGSWIFSSSYIPTIHVPEGSGEAYKSATNWSNFASKIVEDIIIE